MGALDLTMVTNVVLAGIVLSVVMAIGGMILWYIKVRPEITKIKADLEKKAASDELSRIATELERKKEDTVRIQSAIESKQDRGDCDLLRKGCQPLLIEQMKGLVEQINNLKEGQKTLFDKLDNWMVKNGKQTPKTRSIR